MSLFNNINLDSLIGHKTIIYGEVDTKKTYYTANFIQFLLEVKQINPKVISILDFAPKLMTIKGRNIGGRIKNFYKKSKICNYLNLQGEIIPPRLKAKNREEFYANVNHNYKLTSKTLKQFRENPTSILIINDISIFLHAGDEKLLLIAINNCETFFGNSYYGTSIKCVFAPEFNLREKQSLENILKKVDNAFMTK